MENKLNNSQMTSNSITETTKKNNILILLQKIKKNKFLKILSNITFFIFIIIFAVLLTSIILSKITNSVPNVAGYQMYIVLGGSMNPTFDVGSLAIIDEVPTDQIKVEDVITFKNFSGEGITTHRVVNIENSGTNFSFITRGDANDVNDVNPVSAENVIGKVVFTIPYLGRFFNFAQSRSGLLVLIILPGLILIFIEVLSMVKTIKNIKGNKKENAINIQRGDE